jgi:small GTP-binding protein|tara:strand:+ start:366 stop:641 length:276 start_codon:yes stop_codon:yes gene_type:complete
MAYDSTSTESFENITNWVRQVKNHAAQDVKIILLGNKADMTEQKVITKEMGEAVARENNMKFFETSAKSGLNITEAFEFIARDIIKTLQEK